MSVALNPRYSFESFVVGGGNRLAVAAAKSVAENPGTAHNPLFVYSETGLGKTHLLMAVGHAARELEPDLVIRYLTLDDFLVEYEEAVSTGRTDELRDQYAAADMLLLDDVQFLGNRRELQAELLRLSAQMQEAGAQIVLTSDRPPSDIADLDDRLLANLGGGLVVDIAAPDVETRLAILNRRSDERGVIIDREVLEVVATGGLGNVRELLGVLNRLIAFQAVSEHPLTAAAARALVTGDGGEARPSESGAAPADARPPTGESPASSGSDDEFGFFLSGVTATVSEQVERLGGTLRDAIEKWSAKGYRTHPLEEALTAGDTVDAEAVLSRYEESVASLRALQHQMAECDPEQSGDPVFRDPERLADATAMVTRAQNQFEPPPSPSEAFSLDDFLESDDTKMAVEAARSIARDPGTHYNPFVIVAGSGQGKTHLLHAIGREIERGTEGMVACVSAQAFVDQLVHAIEVNRVPSWRARYRRAHAFLLDNIDLLGEREQIQEELFYIFNMFEEAGRQLIFTSNVPPPQIAGLDQRLTSRLEGGLVVTLAPPDRGLRHAVVQQQLKNRTGQEDAALADYLADQPADSVRSVLGLGHRVLTNAEARGVSPTVALAQEVLAPEDAADLPSRTRSSGVTVLPSGGIENPEKVVFEWPDPLARIIEDFR